MRCFFVEESSIFATVLRKNRMKKRTITAVSTLTILLAACISRTNYDPMLMQADSLMPTRPDIALYILQDVTLQQFSSQADRAYYALLITQAKDKNYIQQTNDSLIRTAVEYYTSTNNKRMQAEAYYYWGCTYRDTNQ